jgi:hypothetical protein
MRWRLTVRSPKATATHCFESDAQNPDDFVKALRDWGLAGMQEVNGRIQAVKPLSITVEAINEPTGEVAQPAISALAAGD